MILRIKALAISCLVFLVSGCQAGGALQENGVSGLGDHAKEFIKLFDYEIQNRAFAHNSLKASVDGGVKSALLDFQKAYLSLEVLNQRHYAAVASKYQFDLEPRWWTRVRTKLGGAVSAMMPATALKSIHRATVKYVPKLERLEQIAPAEDKRFFQYVVAQEQVQADAMGLFLKGEHKQAVMLFDNFVRDNQALSFTGERG